MHRRQKTVMPKAKPGIRNLQAPAQEPEWKACRTGILRAAKCRLAAKCHPAEKCRLVAECHPEEECHPGKECHPEVKCRREKECLRGEWRSACGRRKLTESFADMGEAV